MAGRKGKSGRPRSPGRRYRFSYRYRPDRDPPELKEWLERLREAEPGQRQQMLRAALLGGLDQEATPGQASGETDELFNDLFG